MIVKYYDLEKLNLQDNYLMLLYGKNDGLKKETINKLFKYKKPIFTYDEKEILENADNFLENLVSKSLFETEKIIIIKRTTDKILKIVEKIIDRKVNDTIVVFNSDNLEKKSKLRLFFEKDKKCSCTPFYPDDEKTLSKFAHNILKEKKIPMSYENINIIINRCDGDRQILKNELEKIEFYCKNGKTINSEKISKLVNLIENYSISELVDNCLAKNKKKIINIFNENNFSNDECILITRTLLNKSKKILKLSNEYENNKDINLTISSAKPPIFWKDKEITKQQIYKWNPQNIKKLIYKINELELLIKNNISDPINLVTDFILSQSSVKN